MPPVQSSTSERLPQNAIFTQPHSQAAAAQPPQTPEKGWEHFSRMKLTRRSPGPREAGGPFGTAVRGPLGNGLKATIKRQARAPVLRGFPVHRLKRYPK